MGTDHIAEIATIEASRIQREAIGRNKSTDDLLDELDIDDLDDIEDDIEDDDDRDDEAQAAYDEEWGTDNGYAPWDDQTSAGDY